MRPCWTNFLSILSRLYPVGHSAIPALPPNAERGDSVSPPLCPVMPQCYQSEIFRHSLDCRGNAGLPQWLHRLMPGIHDAIDVGTA